MRANPKSVIFASPSYRRIFAGFISQWIMFFLYNSCIPETICLKKAAASGSDNLLFSFDYKYEPKSPSEQNSMKMYKL
jgi:hypothetical protein